MSQSKSKINIVLTGGHAATTGYATVEELKKRDYAKNIDNIYWIGSKRAFEGKATPSFEYMLLPKLEVKFKSIITGRIQTYFSLWTIPSILKIPIGFVHALVILLKLKPKIILSFGGYVSVPVVIVGYFLRIPIIIHEQTSAIGRANKLCAKFADKILVAREESLKYVSKEKAIVVGNPTISSITKIQAKDHLPKVPTIYITGGSRGSIVINNTIKELIDKLTDFYNIIHQTGLLEYSKFRNLRITLSKKRKERYKVYSLVETDKLVEIFKSADLVIARAGANTVSDVLSAKRPAIYIPLPHAHLNEQEKNARLIKDLGLAKIIKQKALTSKLLLKEVRNIFSHWNSIVKRFKIAKNPDLLASKKVVDIMLGYLIGETKKK